MAAPVADALTPVIPGPAPGTGATVAGSLRRVGGVLRTLEITIPAAILVVLLFFCFIWPLVYPVPSPVSGSVLNANLPMWSPGHIFGTTSVGYDNMARILYGGRTTFEICAAVQVIGLVIGGLLGVLAGYVGGIVEAVLMRVLDVLIAFPALVLILAIVDSLGQSELHVIWALAVTSIPAFARVARAATLQLKDQPFVVAARMSSVSTWRIIFGHIVPNLWSQMMTFVLLGAGVTMILESGLDYLGYGIPDPNPSWGQMIAYGQTLMSTTAAPLIVPSLFLLGTVICLNLLADGLRSRQGIR